MEKEQQHGQMAEYMMDNTKWINSMVLVHFAGQMIENIKAIGKMAASMVEDNIQFLMEKQKQDNGQKEKGLNGFSKPVKTQVNRFLIDYINSV